MAKETDGDNPAAIAHARRSDAIASSTTAAFSIALTAPPRRQSGWRTSACPGRPGTADHAVVRTSARDPGLKAGRLGHDAGVGPQAALDQRGAARTRGLLVGVGRDQQIAVERDPERGQRLDREHHRRDPALHVARAAPVHAPVAHGRDERIARPLRTRLRGHDVDMPVEHQRPPAAAPRVARSAAGGPRRTARAEPAASPPSRPRPAPTHRPTPRRRRAPRQVLLQGGLVAARIPDLTRGRVEPDERARQPDQFVATRLDGLTTRCSAAVSASSGP